MAFSDTFILGSLLISFRDVVTMPLVAFILLALFFLGLIYQLFSERVSIIGILSVVAILVFYSAHLLVGGNNGIALILLIIGIVFIIMGFFIIGAFLGLFGGIMLLISIIIVSGNALLFSLFLLVIFILGAIELVIFMNFKKRKIPFLSRFILTDATDAESGYTSFDDRSDLVGETATTMTPFRPAGIIRHGEERIDAVTEGAFIESNVKVKVIEVEGTRVVVRLLEE